MVYWYKLESHYGAGHQSTEIRYLFFQEKLSDMMVEDYQIEECDRVSLYGNYQCVTRMELIDSPPPEAVQEMLTKAEQRRDNAEYVIGVLKQCRS